MSDIRIVEYNSTRNHGQMNKAFYPKDMPESKKIELMHKNKQGIISEIGLDYKKIFIPCQKNSKNPDLYKDGYCYTLTKEDVMTYEDLYDFDVYADIIKLIPETVNISVAIPAGDCAIVKAVNMKTNEVVLSHCGGEYIDRYLPMQTIDALGGNESDIQVYVSPFAHSLYYDDASKLVWANNENVWAEFKRYDSNGGVTIDICSALVRQFRDRKLEVDNIHLSPYDISTCDLFYSNHRGYYDEAYKGRFLSGIAIVDKHIKIKDRPYIKIIK